MELLTPNTRYGVRVKAFTQDKNGNFVAGDDVAVDASFTSFSSSTDPTVIDSSLGFIVTVVPDAPTHVSIQTGK